MCDVVSRRLPKRGCHGRFLPVVYFVRPVLAHSAVRASDISVGLASDTATADFWHRRSWSSELNQRAVLSPGEVASRTARYLTRRRPPK